jgi:glycosyl transferase family 25
MSVKGCHMHIFVVNLPEDVERCESIGNQLDRLNLTYEIFQAVRGANLTIKEKSKCYNEKWFIRNEGRPAKPGELGCALSHVGIYRLVVERGLPYALILEDDAWLNPNLPHLLNAIEQKFTPAQEKVFLLSWAKKISVSKMQTLWSSYRIVHVRSAFCTHAYVVTNKAAVKLLENLHPVQHMADCWGWLRKHRLVTLHAVIPPCITLDLSYESVITPQSTSIESRRSLVQNFLHKAYRAWWLGVDHVFALIRRVGL